MLARLLEIMAIRLKRRSRKARGLRRGVPALVRDYRTGGDGVKRSDFPHLTTKLSGGLACKQAGGFPLTRAACQPELAGALRYGSPAAGYFASDQNSAKKGISV